MVAQYKYDPFGRRIEKNVNGTITRYVYDGLDVLFELDALGNVVSEYVHGPGIDEPAAMTMNGQIYYYHSDGLGSITAITDASGDVVQRYEYDAYGNITFVLDAAFVQPYTFTGREYDEETGLYYYRARYYDAKTGRFTSEDPIGFAGEDVNLMRYVGNNSVNFLDPLGLYERNVHYDLTYRLAVEAGFTRSDALAIAMGNQDTDDFVFDAWYWPFGGIQKHFMSYDYAIGNLNSTLKYNSLWYFGQSLHILQDSYSHSGYEWYKLGHLKDSTTPDSFCKNGERDRAMINMTWVYLLKYKERYYPSIRATR